MTQTRNVTTGILEFSDSVETVELENLVGNNSIILDNAGNKLNIDYLASCYQPINLAGKYINIDNTPCKVELISGGLTGAKKIKLSKYKR